MSNPFNMYFISSMTPRCSVTDTNLGSSAPLTKDPGWEKIQIWDPGLVFCVKNTSIL
jgi:hypothetical protein